MTSPGAKPNPPEKPTPEKPTPHEKLTPSEKLVELLDTLPAETRREITVWLLGQGRPAPTHAWLAGPELRASSAVAELRGSVADLRAGSAGVELRAAAAEPGLRAGRMFAALASSLPAGEESQLVTIRLPAERHAELRTWCTDHGFTMAAVVRGLVERFLEDQQKDDQQKP
jgi:hypothetical protein